MKTVELGGSAAGGVHRTRARRAARPDLCLRPRFQLGGMGEIGALLQALVAIREARNLSSAAARFGMAQVSLTRWIGRRKLSMPSASPTVDVAQPGVANLAGAGGHDEST